MNVHPKFCANWILFAIRSKNPTSMDNFKYKNLKIIYFTNNVVIGNILSRNLQACGV